MEQTRPNILSAKYILPSLFLAFLALLPFIITSPAYMQIIIILLFYAYLTTSWNVVGGFAGVLPLGHAGFLGIGAYTSTLLYMTFGVSPWIGMLAGGLLSALIGILIGLPTFKLKGAYFALATIALGETMRITVGNIEEIWKFKIYANSGIQIPLAEPSFVVFQFADKGSYYYVILAMLLGALLLTYLIYNSKTGYYLRAGGEEQEVAESLGVNVPKFKLYAMSVSAFLTALAGTFYAQLTLYFYPRGIMSLDISFEIAFIAIVGGRGTVAGPILGALLLRPISELTRIYWGGSLPGLHLVIFGIVLVVVIILQPRGIQPIMARIYERILEMLTPTKEKAIGGKTGVVSINQ
ncbi:MAG: branched-chain amino acid ABC transporter permease [Deltaproteobacteria bacterium]|nr:branched-chain amino acid ABC transporter permease [Deltaproteobacteria bacterium]